jgi:hypothetical protein
MFYPENGGLRFLRNIGTHVRHVTETAVFLVTAVGTSDLSLSLSLSHSLTHTHTPDCKMLS